MQSATKTLGEIWIGAEIVLFVLVGTAADIRYAAEAGPAAVGMILLALVFRSAGVWLCMMKTALDKKERLFCVISYLPKATVQAAIGTIPLSMGIPCGKIISVTAILAIVVTAPLGAVGMEAGERKLLSEKK